MTILHLSKSAQRVCKQPRMKGTAHKFLQNAKRATKLGGAVKLRCCFAVNSRLLLETSHRRSASLTSINRCSAPTPHKKPECDQAIIPHIQNTATNTPYLRPRPRTQSTCHTQSIQHQHGPPNGLSASLDHLFGQHGLQLVRSQAVPDACRLGAAVSTMLQVDKWIQRHGQHA